MQKRIDLANQTFGRLTVISFLGSSSKSLFLIFINPKYF
ncbi:hypothetical protein LCAA2362_0353 [Lacticaseibacillus casei A2-362]|nr:hypothetical protein LCAA2362_0353 [Lacticaseibacillus casei A2-362]